MDLLFPLLILALLVPMFLGIRRQKKEMAKTAALQDSLQIGDRVVTTAGLYGIIEELEDDTVDLRIAPGVITTWSRLVIREVVVDIDDEEYEELDGSEVSAQEQAEDSRPSPDKN
ncbi:preprotein translocase subunit YajC [Rhodococcus triatomae]|uniref:Preprotein translocase subunit YajC n=1 Tax=Rhodococcus triatomae TaxID=300028 RepID=A0A1G8KLZ2_9NOCA|nr:preprotein translocase subunit YajC [Rhodococcus triatomae]QNG21341.1 preprotein translocase subunit YajC [Rhodococcus triatomae]QNG25920.1 preprotein translocase subunit YajC [Rhodococcus triatomae]SDI43900.1 preprotein translocase subunit YajC [Rhodococcus triatomae]